MAEHGKNMAVSHPFSNESAYARKSNRRLPSTGADFSLTITATDSNTPRDVLRYHIDFEALSQICHDRQEPFMITLPTNGRP